MKTVIVLVMHGTPPNDFPKDEMSEFFGLHARLEHAGDMKDEMHKRRYQELENKMRNWPRSAKNDPFYIGSKDLTKQINQATGFEVMVGFNEFCAPNLDEAFDQAVATGADKIIVITPMMTRGGKHSEVDIPKAIQQAQKEHPKVDFLYAWPFETSQLADFLARQIAQFL